MIDFTLSDNGDLVLTPMADISACEGDRLRYQMALCRIKSISKDWFYDNIGADLEKILGEPLTTETNSNIKRMITNALVFDDYFKTDDIFINTSIRDKFCVTINVYIKTLDQKHSFLINVELDLVKGINVKIGE